VFVEDQTRRRSTSCRVIGQGVLAKGTVELLPRDGARQGPLGNAVALDGARFPRSPFAS
jgi:hypothetical protein